MTGLLDGYRIGDLVVVAVAAVSAALATVALLERRRIAPAAAAPVDVRPRRYPSASRALLAAPGTSVSEEVAARAGDLRWSLRASVLVLPVIARPAAPDRSGGRTTGLHVEPGLVSRALSWHDAVDSWLWHEYWLRSTQPPPTTLPLDGLVIGQDLVVPHGRGRTGRIPAHEAVSVLPAAGGVILTRPAATTAATVVARASRDARVVAAEARRRPQSGVLLAHGLIGAPAALLTPVAGLLLAVPVEVVVASLLPAVVGVVSAMSRWSALGDLDRSTTLRVPLGTGPLLVVSGPLHAALVWAGSWHALRAPRPLDLARRDALGGEAAA